MNLSTMTLLNAAVWLLTFVWKAQTHAMHEASPFSIVSSD